MADYVGISQMRGLMKVVRMTASLKMKESIVTLKWNSGPQLIILSFVLLKSRSTFSANFVFLNKTDDLINLKIGFGFDDKQVFPFNTFLSYIINMIAIIYLLKLIEGDTLSNIEDQVKQQQLKHKTKVLRCGDRLQMYKKVMREQMKMRENEQKSYSQFLYLFQFQVDKSSMWLLSNIVQSIYFKVQYKIMKQSSRQKFRSKIKKLQFQTQNNTALPSPIDQQYTIKGDYISLKKVKNAAHPSLRKFNVRRLNKTQQSRSNSKQKNTQHNDSISNKFQNLLKNYNQKQDSKLLNLIPKEVVRQKIKTKARTLDVKIKKYRPARLETEHLSLLKGSQRSPYLQKYRFRTINSSIQNKIGVIVQDSYLTQEKNKYSFMTKFQLQEIQKYQIFYPGQRRIPSISHFTDNEGNVKISIGDSIAYRYEVKNHLGQGSFGQVFRVLDHRKKQQVALKIIKNHPKFNRQAKIQIKILQTVLMQDQHSQYNIVKLKHAFFFRGHACLVFQLLHINLYQFLRNNNFRGLSIDLIRRIGIQILQGLMFFQKFNIVHCDLKPQNILLKQQNKTGIKIIDVGSGTFQEEQMYTYIQSRFYRAPQIILGIRYTGKIDIWSFGCILCQLHTGYPIFPGQSQEQQLQMLMEILGVPPRQMLARGSRANKFFEEHEPRITANSKGKTRTPNSKPLSKKLKNCQDKKFISFIQKCLKWIPQQRFKPSQALLDPWILEGLPEEIRQQHIDIVNSQKT